MINRDNYKAMCGYLRYEAEVLMRDDTTLERHESMLKHVLRWLDDYSLNSAPNKRPVLALYLVNTGCVDGTELTEVGIKRICREARTFFTHLLIQYPRQYRAITPAWIDTLRPPKLDPEIPEERVVVTLEMLQQVNHLKSEDLTLAEWRDKAAGCFLFLSAMRATAFVTMPIKCFNFQTRIVKQFPKLGVRTKNRKSKETHLLEIPELLEEVRSWDCFVRDHLPETAPWYPVIDISLGQQVLTANAPGRFRAKSLSDNLKALFERADLEPMSPHKFRHGHAVYAMKQAKSIADLKALSQNMMHESIGTTEIIYGKSPDKEMHERIARLGQSSSSNADTIAALEEILAQLKR